MNGLTPWRYALLGAGLLLSLLGIAWVLRGTFRRRPADAGLDLVSIRWQGTDIILLLLFWLAVQTNLGLAAIAAGRWLVLWTLRSDLEPAAEGLVRALEAGILPATEIRRLCALLASGPSGALALAGVFLAAAIRSPAPLGSVGLRRFPSPRRLLELAFLWLCFLLPLIGIIHLWRVLLGALGIPVEIQETLVFYVDAVARRDPAVLLLVAATALLVAPAAEEILFRGLLYGFLRKWLGPVAGAVLSALAFAIIHITPATQLPIFILGLLLCAIYERRGSLIDAIFFHSLFNLMTLLEAAFPVWGEKPPLG